MVRRKWAKSFIYFFVLPLICKHHATTTHAITSEATSYARARQVRALSGHDEAQSLYAELLKLNPHDTTAATKLGADPNALDRHSHLGKGGSLTDRKIFIKHLRAFQFTPKSIADFVFPVGSEKWKNAQRSSAPLYLTPLRAGSKAPPLPACSLTACIQLFLMAVCIPVETCRTHMGNDMVDLMASLGIAFDDGDGWLVPYCHVMPVNVGDHPETLYFATDLHPNVLSTSTIGEHGAVMYIGPDSLALLDHSNWYLQQATGVYEKVVDIGAGSGIQAIYVAARLGDNANCDVTSIDINPRALKLTRLNYEWNGLEAPRLVLGDITEPFGSILDPTGTLLSRPWEDIMQGATRIVANPPFLPVPVQDPIISKRYGYFSSGGASGDIVLQRIIELASRTLSREFSGSTLAIVSEFMNPGTQFPLKFQSWWSQKACCAVLFTNQEPLDAMTYATRRADSPKEMRQWILHLEQEGISNVSPGLLFVKYDTDPCGELHFSHHPVPKSQEGSIWTPTNMKAREVTEQTLKSYWC